MYKKEWISIIIPIYNGEKWVRYCIEGILAQSYSLIEIILVNDGSTDNTISICQEYVNKYKNIIVIDKPNGGPSSARNEGLKIANGEYILFVDCDDKIPNNFCRILMENVRPDIDILQFGIKCTRNGSVVKTITAKEGSIIIDKGYFNEMKYWQSLFASACSKLYRREYIQIYFNEEMRYGEDLYFNIANLKKGTKVKWVPDVYYYVSQDNRNSLNQKYHSGRIIDIGKYLVLQDKVMRTIYENEYDAMYFYFRGTRTILNAIELCAFSYCFENFKKEIQRSFHSEGVQWILKNAYVDGKYRKPEVFFLRHKFYFIAYQYLQVIRFLKNIKQKFIKH